VAVAAVLAPVRRAEVVRLAQVVEEQVDRRAGELARPVARGRVERHLDAVEAVPAELALEEHAQRLVQVGEHRVQRNVNDQRHPSRP
jgi:hypothetical protein